MRADDGGVPLPFIEGRWEMDVGGDLPVHVLVLEHHGFHDRPPRQHDTRQRWLAPAYRNHIGKTCQFRRNTCLNPRFDQRAAKRIDRDENLTPSWTAAAEHRGAAARRSDGCTRG